MDLGLKGKRAFVSGSSSGIGTAIALELAAEGADVVVHGRDAARTEEVAQQVRKQGVQALAVTGALTDDATVEGIAAEVTAAFGGIDILVNNAGAILRKDNPAWSDLEPAEWLDAFNLNMVSAVRLCRLFTPGMVEAGWGRIVNISTMAARQRNGRTMDYAAAKSGLETYTVSLAKLLGRHAITANCISPGVIRTSATETWLKTLRQQNGWPDDPVFIEQAYARDYIRTPAERMGHPREIAAMAAMLASPLSGYVNGVVIPIDGGTGN